MEEATLRHIYHVGLLVLLASVPTISVSQREPGSIQQCLAAEADREGFSGSILVSQGNKTLARVVRGELAEAGSHAIDTGTRFNLGSASKMFTAVAIGQLIDEGKLRLDEPVGDVVTGLTPEASQVTIRQLLNHTSGLGDFFHPENMSAMLQARTASDILPLIAKDKPAFPPGSKFSYSNTGFALLGIVVERSSGLTYGEYLRRHVFGPAGMNNTGLDPKPLNRLAVAMTGGGLTDPAAGHQLLLAGPDGKPLPSGIAVPSGGPPVVLISPGGRPATGGPLPSKLSRAPGATEGYGTPAGGLFSTAEDMNRFALAFMSGKLVRPATAKEFTSTQIEAAPAASARPAGHYGFGFGLSNEGDVHWFGHNGGTLGANVEFWVQPEHQWVISVLSNRDPPTATNIMRWIRALFATPLRGGSCHGERN